ncbi:MAG TPA: YdeI/OmpD-associated family protein, partial [Polyangiaceae bacterium]|nr:YdeI/OmpD-associated family protein [Polyangiaceae bacterium]
GIWLKLAKKASKTKSVSYAEAVEVALCWGWIDGQKQTADEGFWLQKITPRGRRSIWSELNRKKALALIAAGRMHAPGLAEVERAKADGRWQAAYAPAKTASVPPDLTAALAKNARARKFFETLEARNRYAILWRIGQAKKPETRAARIAKFVAMLGNHEKLHP